MFLNNNLRRTTDIETIKKNEVSLRNRKIFSIILVIALFAVMTMDVFSQEFERKRGFNNGYYGYWGYVDKSSRRTIIPYEYVLAKDFSEGLAAVERSYLFWGFIDKTGREVIPFNYNRAKSFSAGFAAVKLKGKWIFIDKTGKKVIPFDFQRAKSFSAGFAAVKLKGKWIFIDKTGNGVTSSVVAIARAEERERIAAQEREKVTQEVINEIFNKKNASSKRQNAINCTKKTAFGLDIGIGGGKGNEIFSSALGIRVMHHFNPYFGIDFLKINWITDVAVDRVLNPWTMKMQIMPGVRGNSPTFYKCMSVYAAFRLGYGMHIATGYSGGLLKGVIDFKGLCLETELGINITPVFFVGFSYNYHKGFGDYFRASPWQHTFFTRLGFNFGK